MADELYTLSKESFEELARLVRRLQRQVQDLRAQVATDVRGYRGAEHYLVQAREDIPSGRARGGEVAMGRIGPDGQPEAIGPTITIWNHTPCQINQDDWVVVHRERGGGKFVPCEKGTRVKRVTVCETIACDQTGSAYVCAECAEEGSGGSSGEQEGEEITICNKSCRRLIKGDKVLAYKLCDPCDECDEGSGSAGATAAWHVYHVNRVLHVMATAIDGACPGDGEVDVTDISPMDCSCSEVDLSQYTTWTNPLGLCFKPEAQIMGTWDEEAGAEGGYIVSQVPVETLTVLTAARNQAGSTGDSCLAAENAITFETAKICVPICGTSSTEEETPGSEDDQDPLLFRFQLHRHVSQYLRFTDDTPGSASGGSCVIECAYQVNYFFGLSPIEAQRCEDELGLGLGGSGDTYCQDKLPESLDNWQPFLAAVEVKDVLIDVYDQAPDIYGTAVNVFALCVTDPRQVLLIEGTECEEGSGS